MNPLTKFKLVLLFIAALSVLMAMVDKPASVRPADPRPPTIPAELARINMDGHLYYWSPSGGYRSALLVHAAGCQNSNHIAEGK